MADIALVLDTGAMLAYTKGSPKVGDRIVRIADDALSLILPALCLAEAYRRTDSEGWPYLDVLSSLPQVVVAPVEPDLCPFLGGWARILGRMDLAHAAIEAAANPLVRFMTSDRKLVTKVLPEEWPIIDV